MDSSHAFCDGYAERSEAIQDGDTHLELGDLTVEVPGHLALTKQFDTVHLRFDAALAVIAARSSPGGSTEAFRRSQRLVARHCTGRVGFSGSGVLAGRYDRGSTSGGDGVVALAGVESTIGGDAGDLLIGRDLVQ